ncbi:fused MFS/spermidine synthase [Thauera sinica]|uniref:Fused MFS/spermidine synthase n=1 Tax=Thauera sinica TaxID=2665146 RepID=A0ABW1AQG7_9RHOO|nr:fused MFS/spermidine synthase [Thauera sp. K11]
MNTLFEIPSPFPDEPGTIRLLEPPGSDAETLRARLLDGSYGRPFVLEHGGLRALHFSLGYVQSVVKVADPCTLQLGYAQRMMAFLLFHPRPRRMVMIGLGGGSLVNFCHRHLPATELAVAEIDADVIALREQFRVPPDDDRLRVVHADGAQFVAVHPGRIDVLLVDAFGADGLAEELASFEFYEQARRRLSANGVLVMNVAGGRETYARHVERLLTAFDDAVIAMSVREDGNYVLFAFRDVAFEPRWKFMRAIALELQKRLKLDFTAFAQQLERGQTLRLAQRLSA